MQRSESQYPADWLRLAEKDWSRAEYLLKSDDTEAAGFFLQQAIEKFLKAFLLSHGWKLRRTHDLEALLNEAIEYDASLEIFRSDCQMITVFYLIERYPLSTEPVTTETDIRENIERAKALVDKLRQAIG
ncbi:MAG: HEPN domain-containing protein [Dehalococcoidia bacterium]|nr:HEPN domain-containing protein [Dehalococcoidia bacterium]